jgi:signal transduction protein with GAF and PtsI domain
MKLTIALILFALLTGGLIYQSAAIKALERKQLETTTKISLSEKNYIQSSSQETNEKIEVAEYMGKLQTYVTKLYFSGINNNIALTEFYLHETEEVMEELVDANAMDEGLNISKLMDTYGESLVESIQKQIKKEGLVNFNNHYTNLINSCNACHIQSGHEFIKIIQPQNNPFVNQDFKTKL